MRDLIGPWVFSPGYTRGFIPSPLRGCRTVMLILLMAAPVRAEDAPAATVGMPRRLTGLVLPGTELEPKPLDDRRAPVVVRVVNAYKHGTAHRYDLEFYGLEPGTFDLRDALRRKDGSPTADLPPIPFTVAASLPPGQALPHELEARRSPSLGGYTLLLAGVGVLWGAGLLAILLVGRGKKRAADAAANRVVSVADRLRPLVERALAGRVAHTELAELERTLLAFWRRRLRLEDARPGEAIATLRTHPEAGPLLRQLEAWLHRPDGGPRVDVEALLKPYRDIPQEAMEAERPKEAVLS